MRQTAICTCRRCGKTFEKELNEYGKGASKRLQEKVEWAENGGIDECTDCWKARQREEEKAAGLTCSIRLSSVYDKTPGVWAVFGGDSYSHKDELKAAGCRWSDEYPDKSVMGDLLGLSRPRKAWVLRGEDPEALIETARNLGAAVTLPDEMEMATWAAARKEVEAIRSREQEKTNAALEELGPIPAWPEAVKAQWPEGATWNGKVYGKAGAHRIYLSGKEVYITDEDAEAMERTREARADWRKKKSEIESGVTA